MYKITKIFLSVGTIVLTSCSNNIREFQSAVNGAYHILENGIVVESKQFSIDDTGNMAPLPNTDIPQLEMFFYQGVSGSEAIYQTVQKPRRYVPIKLVTNIIYSNNAESSSHDVSFSDMTAFGKKVSEKAF